MLSVQQTASKLICVNITGLKCADLTIINGAVSTDLGFFVEGAIATYTCNMEFELNGSLSRVCQSDGQWNGTDPTCLSKDITYHSSVLVIMSG